MKVNLKLERHQVIALWQLVRELLESNQKQYEQGKGFKLYPEENGMFLELMSTIAEQLDEQQNKGEKDGLIKA